MIPVARQRGGAGALGLFRDRPTIQNASELFFPEASETEAADNRVAPSDEAAGGERGRWKSAAAAVVRGV